MKLYYSPGACSLSVNIALREAGIPFEPVKVNLPAHTLENGQSYFDISPRGYVPLLELDDGSRHTEAAALLQYVGDLDSTHTLIPAHGSLARFDTIKWLSFVSTELHKTFGWLWHKETADSTKTASKEKLAARFHELDQHLTDRQYLSGDGFTVADAYCFTVINWSNFLGIDLKPYPKLGAYMARVAARPKVREALLAEGLIRQ